MIWTVAIELPWPPSVNDYWHISRGRVYVSNRGKDYRTKVERIVQSTGNDFSLISRLVVHIDAHPPAVKRKRDLDNVFKCTLDALEHARVFRNDEQIDYLSISRLDSLPGGKLRVTIKTKGDEQPCWKK